MKSLMRTVASRPILSSPAFRYRYFARGFSTSQPHCRLIPAKLANPKGIRAVSKGMHKQKYDTFKFMVNAQFNHVVKQMGNWAQAKNYVRNFGVKTERGLADEIELFRKAIAQAISMAGEGNVTRSTNPLFWTLRNAFIRGDVKGLTSEIRYSFHSFMMRSRMSPAIAQKQKELADLRYPMEWFPATRTLQRTIHLHVGPTNSGKTYHALKALESAKSGIYGGPLRLLAHEIYARFTAKGKPCAMVTGEEQRIPEGVDNYFISCTVEMTPLNRVVDVAVIDEIQMIGDRERGWAWTQALLGVMAKEVHVCGEERAVDLVKSICSAIGDKCVVHRYERLSPLKTMDRSLNGDLSKLQKGDAVVAFSRVNLHGIKKSIEQKTGRRCAIVYGSLPPETRAQQAALFNDPDNDYDFLVASDAIGMGLNLEIKRIIFETAIKFDGVSLRSLSTSEIKQIGGRAGRYKTARQANNSSDATETPESKLGLVTTMDAGDLEKVQDALDSNAQPIEAAYIQPPAFVLERFAEYLPSDTPLAFLLLRVRELARVSPMFLTDISEDALRIAGLVQDFPLAIHERLALLNAPASLNESGTEDLLRAIGRCLAERQGGALCDMREINLEMLDATVDDFGGNGKEYLRSVEALHHGITLYLWMSYRFPNVFISQHLAFHVKDLVQARIEAYLDNNVSFRADKHEANREWRRKEVEKRQRKQQRVLGDEGGDNASTDENRDGEEVAVVAEVPARGQVVHGEGPGRWNEPGHEEPLVEEPREYDQLDDKSRHGGEAASVGR